MDSSGSARMAVVSILLAAFFGSVPCRAAETKKTDTVSQYGITWRFAEKAEVGRFVNGDYYVVGPVVVKSIDPEPRYGDDGRNGSELNPSANGRVAFDSRTPGDRYRADQGARPPIEMKPGDSLVSTISVDKMNQMVRLIRRSDKALSAVRTAAVLTCVDKPLPPDAFRPAYCDTENTIYLARNLKRDRLPSLPRVEHTPKLSDWERIFQRPWIDIAFDGFAMPVENGPAYGREYARAAAIATLLLCCDSPQKEKEDLLINVVQVGIDLWGVIEAGYPGWPAHGGHGSGRKLLIVFAGIMLGDEEMQNPYETYPNVKFAEDMQTMFGKSWTGADVVYAGHVGKEGRKGRPDWGPYEHLPPEKWPGRLGESYRRCCTSVAWVGEALAIRLLGAEETWDHDAFLAYADRWMTEDDARFVERIKDAKGWDFSASYLRQGQVWDRFVQEMWERYRHSRAAQ